MNYFTYNHAQRVRRTANHSDWADGKSPTNEQEQSTYYADMTVEDSHIFGMLKMATYDYDDGESSYRAGYSYACGYHD